jgi:hypothetical protein
MQYYVGGRRRSRSFLLLQDDRRDVVACRLRRWANERPRPIRQASRRCRTTSSSRRRKDCFSFSTPSKFGQIDKNCFLLDRPIRLRYFLVTNGVREAAVEETETGVVGEDLYDFSFRGASWERAYRAGIERLAFEAAATYRRQETGEGDRSEAAGSKIAPEVGLRPGTDGLES